VIESVKEKAIIFGDDAGWFEELFNVDSSYIGFDPGGLRRMKTE